MRKYLLLVVVLATSNAFAWSLNARVSSKPVCDRIDTAPAKSALPANPATPAHPDAVVARPDDATPSVAANPNVAAITTATNTPTTPAIKSSGASFGRARNTPRWQSFLPGMFK